MLPFPGTPGLAHVDVGRPDLTGRRPEVAMAGVAASEPEPGRGDLIDVGALVVQRDDAQLNVQGRLGLEVRHGGRADVLDSNGARPERSG